MRVESGEFRYALLGKAFIEIFNKTVSITIKQRGTVQKGIIDRLIWIIHRKRHSLKRTRYASPRRHGRFIGMLDWQIGDGDYKQLRSCWQDS